MDNDKLNLADQIKIAERDKHIAETKKLEFEARKVEIEYIEALKETKRNLFVRWLLKKDIVPLITAFVVGIGFMWISVDKVIIPLSSARSNQLEEENSKISLKLYKKGVSQDSLATILSEEKKTNAGQTVMLTHRQSIIDSLYHDNLSLHKSILAGNAKQTDLLKTKIAEQIKLLQSDNKQPEKSSISTVIEYKVRLLLLSSKPIPLQKIQIQSQETNKTILYNYVSGGIDLSLPKGIYQLELISGNTIFDINNPNDFGPLSKTKALLGIPAPGTTVYKFNVLVE